MGFHLLHTKPLPEPILTYCQLDLWNNIRWSMKQTQTFPFKIMYLKMWLMINWTLMNKLHWNLNKNTNIFFHENVFEYVVCELLVILFKPQYVNTLRPRQNGRRFADDTFKCIFLNENVRISIKISLKFISKGPINNIPALVQIMAWRRAGDKPLSEPMMVRLTTHICVTRPQWVKCWIHE